MTQYIKSYNIANNSLSSVVFGSDVANTINTAAIASAVAISANVAAQAVNTFVTLQTQSIANTPPTINVISITDSSYNVLDDTAANTGGAYLQITGSNFQSGAIVMVGSSNTALTTTLVNSSTLRAEIPAIASGTYPVYVVNTNGGTGIRVNGLTTSSFPAWSTGTTLTGQISGTAFGINIAASSDSNITYSNTTALPAGTTLLANGYFYGTSSPASTTTYTFTAKATDVENQDASRTFSVTVTVLPIGYLYRWGNNTGVTPISSSPVQVGSDNTWLTLATNNYHGLGIKQNGTLWAWGDNSRAQFGVNNKVSSSSPVQVGALTNWLTIASGYFSSFATKTDGTLWSWGNATYGELGIGVNGANRSSPVQIGALTSWSNVVAGQYYFAALKTDGTIWGCGYISYPNGFGGSVPSQLGSDTNWSKIYAGRRSFSAIKTTGILLTQGYNYHGELGQNTTVDNYTMTAVGSTSWDSVSMGSNHALGIKTDGTLWSWGYNRNGQLGLNSAAGSDRSSPVQIGTNNNWQLVNVNGYNSIFSSDGIGHAIKTDGTLWGWGQNNQGQLGLPDLISRSSPTQVGTGTSWKNIKSGRTGVIAISSS